MWFLDKLSGRFIFLLGSFHKAVVSAYNQQARVHVYEWSSSSSSLCCWKGLSVQCPALFVLVFLFSNKIQSYAKRHHIDYTCVYQRREKMYNHNMWETTLAGSINSLHPDDGELEACCGSTTTVVEIQIFDRPISFCFFFLWTTKCFI